MLLFLFRTKCVKKIKKKARQQLTVEALCLDLKDLKESKSHEGVGGGGEKERGREREGERERGGEIERVLLPS